MRKASGLLAIILLLSVALTAPPTASATAPDRPVVADGTLKTADGDLIRAGVTWYGKAFDKATNNSMDYDYWVRAKKTGLNAIRVTNWDQRHYINGTYGNEDPNTDYPFWSIADNIAYLDTMVGYASALGLYVIITPGATPGTYKREYLEHFWSAAAGHFANHTNVIYEITNEPKHGGASAYTNGILNDLAAVYTIMRTDAPNTPILSLSFSTAKERMNGKVNTFAGKAGIDWNNGLDVVSFHPYGTTTMTHINSLKNAYPVMNTEWGYPKFQDAAVSLAGKRYQGQALEQNGISWMNFRAGRSDGRFTEYYDFVNDAKAKGYYWIAGTEREDLLDDWSRVADRSANMRLADGNPSYFGGDASRATRDDSNPGYIVYEEEGLGQIYARIYSHNDFAGIKFYVSHNGDDWQQIGMTRSNVTSPVSGWKGANFNNTNGLPSGSKYVKIELNSTGSPAISQISRVKLTSWEEDYKVVEDRLNVWSVVYDRGNVRFGTANPDNFDGDGSRMRIDDTQQDGYAVYRLADMGGFYAHTYFQAPGVTYATLPDNLVFATSTDGAVWTGVEVGTTNNEDPTPTKNGWRLIRLENVQDLPVGTQYLRIELKTNLIQIGEVDLWTKY